MCTKPSRSSSAGLSPTATTGTPFSATIAITRFIARSTAIDRIAASWPGAMFQKARYP